MFSGRIWYDGHREKKTAHAYPERKIRMKKICALLIAVYLLPVSCGSLAEKPAGLAFTQESYTVPVYKVIILSNLLTPKTNAKLEWSSSDPSVAKVCSRGFVNGVSVGETQITVRTADGTASAVCRVTVFLPVKKLISAEKRLTLAPGTSQKLSFSVRPEDATDKALLFTSSDSAVATVSEDGTVTGVGRGKAKITVSARDGAGAKYVVEVTVNEYDLVFTSAAPQKAAYYYGKGKYTVSGKTRTGCVRIPDLTETAQESCPDGLQTAEFEVTPVKPGADIITVRAGKTTTTISVFVSPDCF